MRALSRREFLRRIAAYAGGVTGAWLLDACAREPAASPTQIPTRTLQAQNTAAPTTLALPTNTSQPTDLPAQGSSGVPTGSPTAVPPAPGIPDLVVARGGEPEELVKRALTALGGIERFVHSGDDVIIKPNICVAYHTYEYAATTNPWVVAALVKLCQSAGAGQVRVLDYPFGGTAEEAYERSGIRKEVEAAGGKMEYMPGYKYKQTDIPAGQSLKQTKIFGDILKANLVINVPIAKHHNLAGLTMGMKNLMGLVANREEVHFMITQRLADLTSLVRPSLTVLDAVRILVAHGPTGGSLDDVKKLDTVIASPDIVAVDSYGTSLFGMKPADIIYPETAAKMGLGISDLSRLKVEEIQL